MPAYRERSSSFNYGGPALVTNGDYLTILANPLEKQFGAVEVRERQALLGDLDSQHTDRNAPVTRSQRPHRYKRRRARADLDLRKVKLRDIATRQKLIWTALLETRSRLLGSGLKLLCLNWLARHVLAPAETRIERRQHEQ